MIYFFDIPRIFKKKKKKNNLICHEYFFKHECIFCGYDAVNMIQNVITIADSFPYTAKFTLDSVRNNKTQQIRC